MLPPSSRIHHAHLLVRSMMPFDNEKIVTASFMFPLPREVFDFNDFARVVAAVKILGDHPFYSPSLIRKKEKGGEKYKKALDKYKKKKGNVFPCLTNFLGDTLRFCDTQPTW